MDILISKVCDFSYSWSVIKDLIISGGAEKLVAEKQMLDSGAYSENVPL